MSMRRAQSVRHYTRPSANVADDLGVLKEGDESAEDGLRKQLIEKDRENDKLRDQIQQLQLLLTQRPPIEDVQALEKEYKNLELILQGTQRENERCMAELERSKAREKLLERELARLAGENWQSALDIPPSSTLPSSARSSSFLHSRSSTLSSGIFPPPPLPHLSLATTAAAPPTPPLFPTAVQQLLNPGAPFADSPVSATGSEAPESNPNLPQSSSDRRQSTSSLSQSQSQAQELALQQHQATVAHLEQVRMLILGMEKRLSTREEQLAKTVERAEGEVKKLDAMHKRAESEFAAVGVGIGTGGNAVSVA
ncbi:hypothetical protein AX16_006167 [Volvariella volvacea WC 439]|nr:hypothetical protein AX16_006167 [Volvariella volvacea WC 439]